MTERPDFVIAGAAKCGTTALFEYLSRHPGIFMPRIKEPKFFCTDLKTRGGVHTLDEYRALFASAPPHTVTGEASTLYLYSKIAIERIMQHNPKTKVILMLRNPVDAAHSLHAAGWSHRLENIASFEDAWRAQAARLAGEQMPPGWPDPATLQYGPIYRYAEQLRRVFRHVPEGQRHIVIYEEFFADPGRHYARILEFLQVAPDAAREFPVVNPAVGSRSKRLEQLLREPPAWLRGLYVPMRPLFRAARVHPANLLWSLNGTPRRKPVLSPAFRAEMARYFAADVAELEDLLGRQLWRGSDPFSACGRPRQDSVRHS